MLEVRIFWAGKRLNMVEWPTSIHFSYHSCADVAWQQPKVTGWILWGEFQLQNVRLVKDLFDIFDLLLFFGVRWLNHINSVFAAWSKKTQKNMMRNAATVENVFVSFASQWNLWYLLSMQIGSVQNLLQFSALISFVRLVAKNLWSLWLKGMFFFF